MPGDNETTILDKLIYREILSLKNTPISQVVINLFKRSIMPYESTFQNGGIFKTLKNIYDGVV